MGCCHSILCCKRISEEERLIADIFDTMTSDAELTEACVIAVAERSQELVISDLEGKKSILCEQIEQVRDSNAIDLLLISITDEKGNEKFKLTINDLDVSGNTKYRFYVNNGDNEEQKDIESLEDGKSFIFDKKWDNVFLYGKEVDDFHII